MSTVATLPWYASHTSLVTLAQHLYDNGDLPDAQAVIDFMEKPWNWTDEWNEYALSNLGITDPYFLFHAACPEGNCDDLTDVISEFLTDEVGTHHYAEVRTEDDRITVFCRRNAWDRVVQTFGLVPAPPLP